MASLTCMPKQIDPKLTESFFMNFVGVLDASVWWQDDELHAHLVLSDNAWFGPRDFQRCCSEDLGIHQTPRHISVALRRSRAA